MTTKIRTCLHFEAGKAKGVFLEKVMEATKELFDATGVQAESIQLAWTKDMISEKSDDKMFKDQPDEFEMKVHVTDSKFS